MNQCVFVYLFLGSLQGTWWRQEQHQAVDPIGPSLHTDSQILGELYGTFNTATILSAKL